MPDIHCPSCQAAIPFPEGSRQITCPVCRHSFDPLYPLGRPMSQGAQAPEPPRQGFGELRYPGPVGPQPQYPRTPAPPRQYAPSQYPGPPNLPLEQRKRGMPTWATVLLIVVPVVGLLVAAVWYTDYKDSQPPELADKESWYHYYSDDGDFTLLFPDKPIESTGISHSAVGDITTYRAESANLSSDYFVGWWDLPPGSTFDLMNGVRGTVDGPGRSLLSSHYTTHQGVRALVADVHRDGLDGREMLMRVGNRMYMLGLFGDMAGWDFFVENFAIGDETLAEATDDYDQAADVDEYSALTIGKLPDCEVFVGQHVELEFWAHSPAEQFTWAADGLGDGWVLTPRDGGRNSGRAASSKYTASGTFHEAGRHVVVVTVTDSDGNSESDTVVVTANELTPRIGRLKLSSGYRTDRRPWIVGETLEAYPNSKFKLFMYPQTSGSNLRLDSTVYTWDDSGLPDGIEIGDRNGTLNITGMVDHTGEWKLHIDADVLLEDFDGPFRRAYDLTIKVMEIPEHEWPRDAGNIAGGFRVLTAGTPCKASLNLLPVDYPYGAGNWPSEVAWEWDDAELPPGLTAKADGSNWTFEGTPAKPGRYQLKLKAKVSLRWVARVYEIERTVTFDVG